VLKDARHISIGVLLSVLEFLLLVLAQTGIATSLALKSFLSLLSVGFVGFLFHSGNVVSVGVDGIHNVLVGVGVDLLLVGLLGLLLVSDGSLDFIRVDDSGDVGVGDDSLVEVISTLFTSGGVEGTEDLVQGLEGVFSEDEESSQMTTGSELLKVKSVDIADVDTGDVSDTLDEVGVFVGIDEKRTSSGLDSVISELALTGSGGSVVDDSFNIFISTNSLQESNDFLSLFKTFDLVVNNEGEMGDLGNLVTSSKNEGSDSGSSQSGGNGVSLLLEVDLSMPSSPGLKGSEHSTLSTHVTEGTLTRSVGT